MTDSDGHLTEQTEHIYGKSPLTGQWYRITEWDDRGDGKVVAESKEEVDESEVPQEWVEATEANMDG